MASRENAFVWKGTTTHHCTFHLIYLCRHYLKKKKKGSTRKVSISGFIFLYSHGLFCNPVKSKGLIARKMHLVTFYKILHIFSEGLWNT